MASKKTVDIVNMTSTQIFKRQVDNIYGKLRHENTSDGRIRFAPTHMGGVYGQRDILTGRNVMREITVVNT
mgnify:FL=1